MSKIKKLSEISIDEAKRIADFGLLQDEEVAALGNLMLAESVLRQLSNEGHDQIMNLPVHLQDACDRAAAMLFDSYTVLRRTMLQFATKEAIEAGNIPAAELEGGKSA